VTDLQLLLAGAIFIAGGVIGWYVICALLRLGLRVFRRIGAAWTFALVVLGYIAYAHLDRLVYTLIGIALGATTAFSLPWFTRWLEAWASKRGGLDANYWCKRCRVGTNNPRCYSCKQRDKTERSAARHPARGAA
jgi:hypothetical protein